VIEVANLRKNYEGHWAVRGVSFRIEEGDIFGFIGPNGAGKTTTIRIISTLLEPTSGTVSVGGRSVTGDAEGVRRLIGFMPDNFGVYERITVWEYLDFFAAAYGLERRQRAAAIEGIMELTDLVELRDRLTGALSKGMRQRLCLAKTLVHDPKVLILDEPANGLDPRARIEFRALLKELAAAGKGILISSHILPELGEMCDSVVVIEKGRRVVSGTIAEIQKSVQHEQAVAMRVLADAEGAQRFLLTQPFVGKVGLDGLQLRFEFAGDEEALGELLGRACAAGVRVVEFARLQADLEDIFLKTTKGNLQ
jgi:ABC-2 type transport system ATP-binding protein